MFKVNNKDTRTTSERRRSGVFIVNVEHISQYFSISIVNFEQVNVRWVSCVRRLIIFLFPIIFKSGDVSGEKLLELEWNFFA